MLWLFPSLLSPVGSVQAAIVADLLAGVVADFVAQQVRRRSRPVVAKRRASYLSERKRGKKVFLMKNLCKYSRLRDLCTKNKCQIIVNNDIGLQKFTKGSLSKPQMMNWRLRLSVFLVLFLRSQKKVLVTIHNNKANLMPHKNFMGQWLIKISPCLHFNHKVMKILLWKRIGIGEDKNTPKWIQLLIFQR